MKKLILALLPLAALISCAQKPSNIVENIAGEKHLANVRMLTMQGENAEAYFSHDDRQLIFQSTHGDYPCDQIFKMNLDGSDMTLVSTGLGRTTCSYFLPGNERIIYASTHAADPNCPPPADLSKGYVWKVYSTFELYTANADGSDPQVFLPAPGYDAEATVSPQGDKIVFTSQRNGDLDIYTVNIDGTDLKQVTNELGYDGGPFFSWDGTKIVYRCYHPQTDAEIDRYTSLLADEMIEPSAFQIWVMNADGSNKHQVTHNEFANFAPFFFPDDQRIIFCSNIGSSDPRRPDFNLWKINEDGSGLEQITFYNEFDGFPMFSHDGTKLVFASNRYNKNPRDTNVFLADWIE